MVEEAGRVVRLVEKPAEFVSDRTIVGVCWGRMCRWGKGRREKEQEFERLSSPPLGIQGNPVDFK